MQELPYGKDALAPFISARTVEIHYEKHHKGYANKLTRALEDEPELVDQPLDHIVVNSYGPLFNLAAQVWNHNFYWHSLIPGGTALADDSRLKQLIDRDFGGIDEFRQRFAEEAINEFGSGWAWLAYQPETEKLEIFSTTDAVNPMPSGRVPLLTLDVWEHAYYLDYQNERGRYIDEFLDGYVHWQHAEACFQTYLDSQHS
ncbi:MAG: superoxide dismutase [Pseudomonadota bacterium]